jgi:acetate kinase
MLASLGGLDALVFTGGIGEHSSAVRDAVCDRWRFLGAQVLVVPTEENWEIARESYRVLR